MKILHAALIYDFYSASGIVNQMYDELQSAKEIGINFDVKVFSPSHKIPDKYKELFVFVHNYESKNKINSWINYRKKYYSWLESQSDCVDCYILRYSTYDPFQYFFIKNSKKPVYLVHHTKELDELHLLGIKGILASYFDRFWGNKAIRLSTGIIAVTNELINYEKNRINDSNKRSIVYPNGIKIKNNYINDRRGEIPEILFVASFFYNWHGLDILIDEAKRSNLNFLIHIVGDINHKDAQNLKADKKFIYHSKLSLDEIDNLSERCWIALGSFALYRKNLEEASTLKVREYLNNGLPVYSGHFDQFPKDFLFYKKSNLNLNDILEFAYEMREYSKEKVRDLSIPYISKKILLKNLYNNISKDF